MSPYTTRAVIEHQGINFESLGWQQGGTVPGNTPNYNDIGKFARRDITVATYQPIQRIPKSLEALGPTRFQATCGTGLCSGTRLTPRGSQMLWIGVTPWLSRGIRSAITCPTRAAAAMSLSLRARRSTPWVDTPLARTHQTPLSPFAKCPLVASRAHPRHVADCNKPAWAENIRCNAEQCGARLPPWVGVRGSPGGTCVQPRHAGQRHARPSRAVGRLHLRRRGLGQAVTGSPLPAAPTSAARGPATR